MGEQLVPIEKMNESIRDWKSSVGKVLKVVWLTRRDNPWFGLVWFYDISISVGYLMPNLFYKYIVYIWFLNSFCR